MKMVLTKIKASNIYGKVTREVSKEYFNCDFEEAVRVVEDKYFKDLIDVIRYKITDYAVWEEKYEYEPGKIVGIRYKLEPEDY